MMIPILILGLMGAGFLPFIIIGLGRTKTEKQRIHEIANLEQDYNHDQ